MAGLAIAPRWGLLLLLLAAVPHAQGECNLLATKEERMKAGWAAGCSCADVCAYADSRWDGSCREKEGRKIMAMEARCIYEEDTATEDRRLCRCGRHIGTDDHRSARGTAGGVTTVIFILLFVAVLGISGLHRSNPCLCCGCGGRGAEVTDENLVSTKRQGLEKTLAKLHFPVILYSCISIATCWGTFGAAGLAVGALGITTVFFSACSGEGGCACFSVVEVEGRSRDKALCCSRRWSEHVYSFYIATGFFAFASVVINMSLAAVWLIQLDTCKYGGPYNGYDQEWREPDEGKGEEEGRCVRAGELPFFIFGVASLMCGLAALALLWLCAIGWATACAVSRLPLPPPAARPAVPFMAPGIVVAQGISMTAMPVQAVMAQPVQPTAPMPGVTVVPTAGAVPVQQWETAAASQMAVPMASSTGPAAAPVVQGVILGVQGAQPDHSRPAVPGVNY